MGDWKERPNPKLLERIAPVGPKPKLSVLKKATMVALSEVLTLIPPPKKPPSAVKLTDPEVMVGTAAATEDHKMGSRTPNKESSHRRGTLPTRIVLPPHEVEWKVPPC